jgi:hypothetical protein
MSLYNRRAGSGIYGTGYGDLGAPTLPDAGHAIQQTLPRLPEQEVEEEPVDDPETDPSLLRQAADTGISGLSAIGNLLDTPASMVRDILSLRNPLDQLLTPFSDENRTSGEDMLKGVGLMGSEPSDSWLKSGGRWLAGTALEIGLDPLTYLTLGASALGKGGKLAKNAKLLDEAPRIASKKLGEKVGKNRAKQLVTPRELADDLNQRAAPVVDQAAIAPGSPLPASTMGSDKIVEAFNGMNARAIKEGKMKPAASLDEIPAELLDSPIGGNFRFKLPFMNEMLINDIAMPKIPGFVGDAMSGAANMVGGIPLPKTGGKTVGDFVPGTAKAAGSKMTGGRIKGESIAKFFDDAHDKVWYGNPVGLGASAIFSKAVRGAKTERGQKAAMQISDDIDSNTYTVRDELYEPLRDLYDTQLLKGKPEEIFENGNAMLDFMEDVADLPEHLEAARPILSRVKGLYGEKLSTADDLGLDLQALGDVLNYKTINDAGEEIEKALPNPIGYAARQRQLEAGPLWRARSARERFMERDGSAIGRQSYMRHQRTSTINRMSVDPEFAGVFDEGDLGKGRRKRIPDKHEGLPDGGVMGSTPVSKPDEKDLYKAFRAKYDPLAEFTPEKMAQLGMDKLDQEAIDALESAHFDLFRSITRLNRGQVEKKIPMFALNPVENALKSLESGAMTAAAVSGTRRLIADNAKLIGAAPNSATDTSAMASSELAKTAGNNIAAGNLMKVLDNLKMNYPAGMAKMVETLGEPASQVATEIATAKRSQILDRVISELAEHAGKKPVEIADMVRKEYELDPAALRQRAVGIQDPERASKVSQLLDAADNVAADPKEVLERFEIDTELLQDVTAINRTFSSPEETKQIVALLDVVTNLFKTNVTAPFPSFHARNAFSGVVQNTLNGVRDTTQSGLKQLSQPYVDAKALMGGKAIKGASEIPLFADRGLTDEQASEEIRKLIFSRGLVDKPGQHNDIVANMGGSVIDQFVGKQTFKELTAAPDNTTWLQSFNPLESIGVKGGEKSKFAPERYGRVVGNQIETVVRSAPFIALLKQGVDPDEAANMVKRLQVDYSDLGDVERKVIRRAVPFYSFQKGATKYLASELAQKPGGAIAMSIKGAENASGNDPGSPSYIRAGLNIPLSESQDGTKQYLVGAGLMHEPPLQLIGPSVGSTLFNAASMLHPVAKLPIELLTNASLFQEGSSGGGRSLDDMDPLFGRTASNLVNALPGIERETPFRIGKLPEAIIANSPLARYLSTAKKLADPRDDIGTKAVNFLTGAKIHTVDPEDSDAVLREQAESLMRELGGRDFSHSYIPDSVMASLEGEELKKAQQLQELLKLLNNRQRKRKKEKAATASEEVA